jgi:sec-independent protein translocase protein TatB
MFDVGFSELALIAIVALLVLGPERLPRAARTAGALVRRARASWNTVRGEIERELASEDLKNTIRDAKRGFEDSARAADPRADIESAARSIRRDIHDDTPSGDAR